MIIRVKREDLEIAKYNKCIENSIQSNIFGFSWYLDIVCDNWDVLVLNDYEAVMPIPWRKKFFIKYAYSPFWLIQLGIYSIKIEDENEFLIELFSDFKFVETRTNTSNSFSMFQAYEKVRKLQVLDLKQDYSVILSKFKQNRKRDLLKAKKYDLYEKWGDLPENLIALHKSSIGKRVKNISEKDYEKLLKLMNVCIAKKKAEILSIYDKDSNIIASGFYLKYKGRITRLLSASNLKNRKNGANTLHVERAIYKYQNHFSVFDFAGSSIKSIAHFNASFGTENKSYISLKYNNLPFLLKLFKK